MKVYAALFAAFVGTAVGQASDSENSLASPCDDAKEGDICYLSDQGDDDSSSAVGVCTTPESVSACGPDFSEGDKCMMCEESNLDDSQANDTQNSDSKETVATAACDGKDEGDECNYKSLDGVATSGTCTDEGAVMCDYDTCYVCNPEAETDGAADSGATNDNECTGLSVGDSCELPNDKGDGICQETAEDLETGDGSLACAPAADAAQGGDVSADDPEADEEAADEISYILQNACESSKSGDECSYVDDASNTERYGTCQSVDDVLQCDEMKEIDEEVAKNVESACSNLSVGDSCTIEDTLLTLEGECLTNFEGTLFCSPAFTRQLRGRN